MGGCIIFLLPNFAASIQLKVENMCNINQEIIAIKTSKMKRFNFKLIVKCKNRKYQPPFSPLNESSSSTIKG
jgi:hypothetical protein